MVFRNKIKQMPKVSPEDDPSYVPNVVYEVPMKLKPSNVLIGVIAGAVIIAIGVIGALIILYGSNPTLLAMLRLRQQIPPKPRHLPPAPKKVKQRIGEHIEIQSMAT